MKIIVEYTVLHGRPLQKGTTNRGVKLPSDRESKPDHPADFPQQRIEFYVEEGSDAGETLLAVLGLTTP